MSLSELGFGCGSVGGLMVRGSLDEQVAAVQKAIDAGVTYFDTAAAYGDGASEENLGKALSQLNAWDKVKVGTKIRLEDADLDDAFSAVRRRAQESLKRLGRPNVDLIQLHNSIDMLGGGSGIAIKDMAYVAEAMRGLSREGLAKHVGFTALGDTTAARTVANNRAFETAQVYFNALNPSAAYAGMSGGSQDFQDLIEVTTVNGGGVIAIRVLAAGALSGSAERAPNASPAPSDMVPGSEFAKDVERARKLIPLAKELGCENAMELSLRLALSTPGITTALIGFSNAAQVEGALRWVANGPLSKDAIERVTSTAAAAAV
jgi:L-galactose dehydrogenase/L-glyceraldehyde 3-phosphate reductase